MSARRVSVQGVGIPVCVLSYFYLCVMSPGKSKVTKSRHYTLLFTKKDLWAFLHYNQQPFAIRCHCNAVDHNVCLHVFICFWRDEEEKGVCWCVAIYDTTTTTISLISPVHVAFLVSYITSQQIPAPSNISLFSCLPKEKLFILH